MAALAPCRDEAVEAPAGDALATLASEGYAVLRNVAPRAKVASLARDLSERFERTPFCQGDFYGGRTKRFGALLRRSPHAAYFVMHETMLAIADAVLGPWCDCYQLNLTQALEIHPGQTRQAPHRDQDMWRAGPGAEYLINVMWPFTDYTRENGTTLVYPQSHKPPLCDAAHYGEPVAAEMRPGDALVFLGSTLHGAGANTSRQIRRGMIVSYCLGWLKPYENQWLVYPPSVARTFSPDLAALVGYREHRPNLGNYEGQSPAVLLGEARADHLGAVDNLLPEQAERLAQFCARERAERDRRGALSHV